MAIRRKAACAAATIIGTAALAVALAAPALATIIGMDFGTGTTALAAKEAATMQLHADFFGCGPVTVLRDNESGGIWHAEVEATCQGVTKEKLSFWSLSLIML